MISSKVGAENCENLSDDENEFSRELPQRNYNAKKLVKGIDLKDLCDGKEVMFEISEDFGKDMLDQDEQDTLDDVIYYDSKAQRESRGAPPLNCSFESLTKEMINVTEDGLVKKRIVTNGTGKVVPNFSYVTIHYNLYKENCDLPFDSTYLRNRPEKFRLDQGETILGLEYAVKSMKKNENSCFLIKWELAFGEMGCPDRIGPKCDIFADITLINFVEIKNEDLSGTLNGEQLNEIDFNKLLNKAKQLNLNGSDEFTKGEYKSAIKCYRKALRILNEMRLENEEQETVMLKQKTKCLVNAAICYNKIGKSELACLACQEVLSIDSQNVKAYFQYGKASLALSNFPVAKKLLSKANKMKPNDKDINKELKKLNDKIALYEVKDKMFWKKAFENKDEEKEKTEEKLSSVKSIEEKSKDELLNFK